MIVRMLKWLLVLCGHQHQEAAQVAVALPNPGPESPAPVAAQPAPEGLPVVHAQGTMRVPGRELQLAGEMYVIAPLNAAAVKRFRDQIKNVFVGGLPDIELVAQLALCSLQRNYPGMTLARVEELIDYDNFFEVWETLLNVSGLVAQAKEMARRVQEQMEQPASMG
ncbi:hypothetical protein [Duganella sp. Root336D2]|uniref:hypothetical protein n=1 Tax=Duganella sp. Root336D2 TaxID=1736518 RepID=UPI0012E33891|nr:hypothetical protein [Duganella sp. Root336D2]